MSESLFSPREKDQCSFQRALISASEGNLHKTYEGGLTREYAQHIGKPLLEENRFLWPFELMRRDLLAGSGSGSYLVGTEAPFALDMLRPYSGTLPLARVMSFKGDAAVAKETATSTITWLSDETSAISESQAYLGEISVSPKDAGILTQVSHKLARQSNADAFLLRELNRSLGGGLDQVIFAGTGTSGQPHGILGTTGVGGQSGTSLGWTGVTDMLYAISENDAQEGIAWFGTPAVRRLLARRERVSGGGRSIWDDTQIAGYPAIASRVVPADTLFVGAFGEVLIALFQDAVEIVVNPFSGFDRGLISYRGWLSCDVAVTSPAAFSVATSIT